MPLRALINFIIITIPKVNAPKLMKVLFLACIGKVLQNLVAAIF